MTDAPRQGRTLPPWWAVLLVALAIAGIAFAIGRFSTFGAAQGVATPGNTSPEAGFARDMQIHHAQAVQLSMDIYRTTQNEDVRVLAYDIATGQSAQRGDQPIMAWMAATDNAHGHASTGADAPTEAELLQQMGMATDAEIAAMQAETGTAADCTFLSLMIRHHQGAIPMAQALIDLGSDPRALQVAQGIIATQSAEIDLMTSLREGLACTP